MLKQTRLSVSAVKPDQWNFILGLEGDGQLEEDGAAVRGQVVKVHEEVVRKLGRETANGDDADGGKDGITSKLTATSSTGKEDDKADA